jgi:hypothetical protein
MALLVQPGDEKNISVVDHNAGYAEVLGCLAVDRWPHCYQIDTVHGPNKSSYRFDIWVDDEGLLKQAPVNLCASLAAHPLNEFRGRVIYGPALLVPLSKAVKYTLDDWANICQGVWYNEELVERNVRGKKATDRDDK